MLAALLALLQAVTPAPGSASPHDAASHDAAPDDAASDDAASHETAVAVAAALLASPREESMARLDELAKAARKPADMDGVSWAREVLGQELRTGHASNEAWRAICELFTDGAGWIDQAALAFDLAASDRSGLLERALDGDPCCRELVDQALAWPAEALGVAWWCADESDRREAAAASGTLDSLHARLSRRSGEPIADGLRRSLDAAREAFVAQRAEWLRECSATGQGAGR